MQPRSLIPILVTTLLSCAAAAQDDVKLPELGSSAGTLLSPREGHDYGASMLHQMRALNLVLDDPLLSNYVNHLGYRLIAHADIERGQDFTFFVVRDSQINAFAAPGGYIGVNSGLITTTADESELAAVLAHEISHVTQHHLVRAFEDSKKTTPLIALGMLGALLAASQSGAHGDAGQAIIASGMGLMAQNQINFTRKDEAEADRVGIGLLADAGFDPDAMASFFERMERTLRAGAGGEEVPELLRTHPVNSSRISDAKARARVIEQNTRLHPTVTVGDNTDWADTMAPIPYLGAQIEPAAATSGKAEPGIAAAPPAQTPSASKTDETYSNYELMRERARVLGADSPNDIRAYYAQNLAKNPEFSTLANRYGYALALIRTRQGQEAIKLLAPMTQAHADSLPLRLAMADAQLIAGHRQRSLDLYAGIAADSPRNNAVADAYAEALLANGKAGSAKKAAALLKPLLDEADEPGIFRTYARANELAGETVRAAEAYADATFLSGHAMEALDQLKRLAKRPDLDYYQRTRVNARIAQITPIVLELRRRGQGPDQENGQGLRAACPGRGLCVSSPGNIEPLQ